MLILDFVLGSSSLQLAVVLPSPVVDGPQIASGIRQWNDFSSIYQVSGIIKSWKEMDWLGKSKQNYNAALDF